jgi:signal transduction histidine kinase
LRLILTNLLSNAIRYLPHYNQIQFKLMRQKQQLTFEIRDWGIGIPAEDQPYLFEPFYRGRNASNIPGTGLGLSIVKQLVDLQQGGTSGQNSIGSWHNGASDAVDSVSLLY